MAEIIEKEKKKPGPANYRNEGLGKKEHGNYKLNANWTGYFDEIKYFAQQSPGAPKYADGDWIKQRVRLSKSIYNMKHGSKSTWS